MSFSDFVTNWHTVQICHLSAETFSGELADPSDVIKKHIFIYLIYLQNFIREEFLFLVWGFVMEKIGFGKIELDFLE